MGLHKMKNNYQFDFASTMPAMYDVISRERKAKTMVAVLSDFFAPQYLVEKTILDVGSSTGIIDNYLSNHFGDVIGMDIDEKAVTHAIQLYGKNNLKFLVADAMNMQFADNSFDIVICSQVYEHVPDASRLMQEIYRIMKPLGVCFFSAGNRLNLIEPHYKLPLLSVIPKPFAHLYMKLAGKGSQYYETHLSYWSLKKLTKAFTCHDYTKKIVHDPVRYGANYMLPPQSKTLRMAQLLVDHFYFAFPNYIWLLQKPQV
jgi:ubiquinone/menaquinone biosynthesis C-methylase UbiE